MGRERAYPQFLIILKKEPSRGLQARASTERASEREPVGNVLHIFIARSNFRIKGGSFVNVEFLNLEWKSIWNGTETGHIIVTTIGGRNGQPKQTISYMSERVVGNGSFRIVFQAKCLETGETVATKKVLQDKRYKNRELQTMRLLDHPNVVALKHCFFSTIEKDELYINLVLEYVPERSIPRRNTPKPEIRKELGRHEMVVSSLKFEKHGGSRSHNQNAHISLENGISLYVLSKELTNVSLESLGRMIAEKFGYPTIMKVYKD
ncbi:hypothetical protein KSP40_PGU018247 [Platanthera guangdongensis]|uniref:Protein kinase domain-containing protein n=1 Tax=Platanthera guangdongensis TaxID=2320717 RepID=A0ABR2M4Y1_9ASPA